MAVAGLNHVAMLDLDIIAVAAKALRAADNAVGGGVNRGAVRCRNVDAVMARHFAGHRMDPHPVRRRQRHIVDRLARRDRDPDRSGKAGIEALPRLENRAGFAVLGGRRHTGGKAVVIGFVGDHDADIGAGFGGMNGRRGCNETG